MENITFNKSTGRYSIGDKELTCGTTIKIELEDELISARVEHSINWSKGYYLILEDNRGSIPLFNVKRGLTINE